ncbi:hypothetical protein DPMN_119085 [Dreissena polymorpha]|uniref:Uncharacterized protein n=1 Tax=Dreissena polymorpha TaxID=45954 RepID=A0A9D4GPA6_DREPO|nr:hypothetical protein DPMN_119085 [Dreissena polymorpha]
MAPPGTLPYTKANKETAAENNRQARKARATNADENVPLIQWPICSRQYRAKIGLISHCAHTDKGRPDQGFR